MATKNTFLSSPFDSLQPEDAKVLPGQQAVKPIEPPVEQPKAQQPKAPQQDADTRQPTRSTNLLPPPDVRPIFEAAAKEFNVPVNVLMALGHQESRYNAKAIGPETQWGRARGMMQYLDDTAKGLGINPFDPAQAVPAAAKQIRERLDKGYSMEDAVKEHFAGPNRKLWGEKTAAYGREVMEKVGRIGEMLGAEPAAASGDDLAGLQKQLDQEEPGRYRVITPELNRQLLRQVENRDAEMIAQAGLGTPAKAPTQEDVDNRPLFARLGEGVARGYDNTVQSLSTARFAIGAGGDSGELAQALAAKFAAEAGRKKTTGEQEIDAAFNRVTEAKGAWNTTVEGLKAIGAAVTNPKDLAVGVIEQVPNMLPSLGAAGAGAGVGAGAGAGIGALAGGVGAVPGAVTGAILGGRAGMMAGTTATELGAEVEQMVLERIQAEKKAPTAENIKALLDDKTFQSEARERGLKKGLTVAVVDQVFFGLTGKVAGKAGAATTIGRKAALSTGAVGLDATGEVVGEAASQQVARGEVDAGDALREGVYGLGQSVVEPAISGAARAAQAAAGAVRPQAPEARQTAPAAPTPEAPAPEAPAAPVAQPAAPQRSTAPGPLTRSLENAAEGAAPEQRVTVTAPEGQITGFVESYQQDGQGGFVARILGDDGQVYNFTSADQVTITPEAPKAGPLTAAVEAVAAAEPEAPAAPVEAAAPVEQAAPVEPAAPVEAPAAGTLTNEGTSPAPDTAPALADMTEPQLRERLKYIANQAKTNGGWTPMLTKARREVEREINSRAKPEPAADVTLTNEGKTEAKVQAEKLPPTDIRIGNKVLIDGKAYTVSGSVDGGITAEGETESLGSGVTKQTTKILLGDDAIRAKIAADEAGLNTASPAKPVKPKTASKEDLDHLFGIDAKREKAMERIAAGRAWFNDGKKAKDFIAKNGLSDTHEAKQGKAGRWDVVAKAADQNLVKKPEQTNGNNQRTDQQPDGAEALGGQQTGQQTEAAPKAAAQEEVTGTQPNVEDAPQPAAGAQAQAPADQAPAAAEGDAAPAAGVPDAGRGADVQAARVAPGTRINGDVERQAADRLGMLYDQMGNIASRNSREGNSKAIVRTVIEELRKPRTVSSVVPMLEQAAGGLDKNYGAFADVIREVADTLNGTAAEAPAAQDQPTRGIQTNVAVRELAAKAAALATQEKPAEQAAANDTTAPTEPTPPGGGKPDLFAGNKIFTADKVEAARARLRSKLGQLNSGIDPEVVIDGMTIAGAYIEAGVRKFSDYAKAMTDDFGDSIKPYLLSFYEAARNYPGIQNDGMTSVEQAKAEHSALMKTADTTPVAEALGETVAKPAKRTKKTGAKTDMTLTQDWGVDSIDGYGTTFDRETGNEVKDAFLKEAKAYLTTVAGILAEQGFTPHTDAKGRPEKPVSVNEIGVATSGDVSLTLAGPNGVGIYATIGDTALRGVVPTTQSGISVMVRVAQAGDKFGNKDRNRWMAVDLSAADMADSMLKAVGEFKPRAEQPTFNPVAIQGDRNESQVPQNGERALGEASPEDGKQAATRGEAAGGSAGGSTAGDGQGGGTPAAGVQAPRGRGSRTRRISDPATGSKRVGGRRGTGGKGADAPGSDAGAADGRRPDDVTDLFAAPEATAETSSAPNIPAANFKIEQDLALGEGGEAVKFRDNMAAIRTLKAVEAEQRRATPDEQRVLARFVGWGGLASAFPNPETGKFKDGWEKRGQELRELLTPSEYRAASRSTRNAHYTSPVVVKAMWEAAHRLGYRNGLAIETSMGIGNFLGLMPEKVSARFIGVEYDSLTARMAAALYPQATVLESGFQRVPLPDNAFDLNIGNPPFGDESLRFQYRPELNGESIHNQFFRAGMAALKPGRLQIQVVSRYLMDKQDKATRIALAREADLVAAIRLPDNAFKENARTEVVTDIIILKKRDAADKARMDAILDAYVAPKEKAYDKEQARRELAAQAPAWIETTEIPDPLGGEKMVVNRYFASNPGQIIGVMERSGSMRYKNDITVRLDDAKALEGRLNELVERLPQGIVSAADDVAASTEQAYKLLGEALSMAVAQEEVGHIKTDADGKLTRAVEREFGANQVLTRQELTPRSPWSRQLLMDEKGRWYKVDVKTGPDGKPVKAVDKDGKPTRSNVFERITYETEDQIPDTLRLGETGFSKLQSIVGLRDTLKRQLVLETEDAPKSMMEANRKKLADAYDKFVEKFGPINRPVNARLVADMPDAGLILALESEYEQARTKEQAAKSGLPEQDERVRKAPIMSERVVPKYEPPTQAETPADALAINLAERGTVDMDRIASLLGITPEQAEADLTGGDKPLVFKDPETNTFETANAYLSGQVRRKLMAAKAAGLTQNVKALEAVQPERWGAENVSVQVGATWVPTDVYADFMTHLIGGRSKVAFSPLTNTFSVTATDSDRTKAEAWSSESAPASWIYGRLLNSQSPIIMRTDSEGKTYVDKEATSLAILKSREIVTEFQDWVFKDSERRERLVEIFNEKFNTRVTRQYDGSHLKLPGKVPDTIIQMRRHQMNAIWRGISSRFLLIDHAVGAGKTFTGIARAMERRRMGLAQKPAIVVPNHLVEQWQADVYKLYPGAKVLAASKADFEKKNRRKLFGRIATGDYDIVILPHSALVKIGISPETERRYLEQELQEALQAVKDAEDQAKEDGQDTGFRKPLGVKEAERLVAKIQNRMDKLRERATDRLLTFEQLGIGDLTVDEAHEFKNLFYSSRLTKVRGMGDKTGSAKASDLYNKVRVLRDNGGAVVFMTGTPVSNSVVELYTMMRYLAASELRESGMEHFDAWRTQFVDAEPAFEPDESNRLKEVTRLGRSWSNMRAMMDLYYQFTDAVSIDDIKQWYAEDNGGKPFPVPKVKGGDRRLIKTNPTPAQDAMLKEVINGFDSLEAIKDPQERNAERLRLMDRARKLSLDVRAALPGSPSKEEGGKLEKVSAEVKRVYDQWKADRGTQLIFLDRSVPKAKGDDKIIKEYDDLMARRDKAMAEDDDAKFKDINEALEKYDANEIAELRAAQNGGWNAYQQIKDNLIAAGIPAQEIRFVQEANTDEQKQALFDAVNGGNVRVLIGSTPRMGAGTNVQKRLVALHHVDVTWKPSDIEQREGRIVRQGNELLAKYGQDFEVEVLAYATERTVDAKMWSLNATKLKAINGLRKYTGDFTMDVEDEESVSMAEMAALASGNPLLLERVTLESAINGLELQEKAFRRKKFGAEDALRDAEKVIDTYPERIKQSREQSKELAARVQAVSDAADKRRVTVEGKEYSSYKDALKAAQTAIEAQQEGNENARYAININGERVTSKAAIEDAIGQSLGDDAAFEVEIGGNVINQRTRAGRELSAILSPKAQESEGKGEGKVGKMFGYDLIYQFAPSRFDSGKVDLVLALEDGTKTIASADVNGHSPMVKFTTAQLRDALGNLASEVESKASGSNADFMQKRLESAQRDIDMLRSRVKETFPKADEIKQKRDRLREVVAALTSDAPAAPQDQTQFRRTRGKADGVPKAEAKAIVDAIKSRWDNAPEMVVVESMQDPAVPEAVRIADQRQRDGGAKGDPMGFWHGGTAYVVSSSMGSTGDVVRTVMHEVLGHYGLRGVFGRELKPILSQIVQARRQEVVAVAEKYGLDMANPEQALEAAEEVLANMAQTKPELGFVKRAVAVIRNWLRKHVPGFQSMALTDAEIIANYILPARAFVERGPGGGPKGGVSFTRDTNGAMPENQAPGPQGDVQQGATQGNAVTEAAEQILQAMRMDSESDPYADYGLRVIPGDFTGDIATGDSLPPSNRWDDGDDTGEPLGGTSAIAIEQSTVAAIQKALRLTGADGGTRGPNGYYWGDRVVLVKGDKKGRGEDVGEILLKDATVVGMWKKPSKGASAIQPNEQSAPDTDGASFSRDQLPPTIEVDGKQRPTTNSSGKPIHPTEEGVRNFWKWFGDSKAVDAEGRPLVMYHGTSGGRTVFEPYWKQLERDAMPHELKGNGSIAQMYQLAKEEPELHFFAAERGTAESYGSEVVEAHLKIDNMVGDPSMDRDEAIQLMLDQDADGAIFRDTTSTGRYGGVAYVVRRSNQIKSATGNNGAFDPQNADIRFSRQEADKLIDDASDALGSQGPIAKDDYIGRVVGDMSLGAKLIVHPRTVAAVHPKFTPVYRTAISQMETRDEIISDLGADVRAYDTLNQAGKENVNKVLELGRLTSTVYTADELRQGVANAGKRKVVIIGEDGKPKTSTKPITSLLTEPGEVIILGAEEIAAYQSLRKMFDRALDMMRDQTLDELGFPEIKGKPNAAQAIRDLITDQTLPEQAETLRNIAKFVAEIEQAKRAGYVPFARYGDYVVTVKEKVADAEFVDDGDGYIVRGLPESFAEDMLALSAVPTDDGWRILKNQKSAVEKLTEQTVYSAKVETGMRDLIPSRKAKTVEDIPAVRDAIEKARREWVGDNPARRIVAFKTNQKKQDAPVRLSDVDALAEVANIDNATWDWIRDKLADAIKSQGFRKHFFHSDNVPGYTGDFERSIADYVIGMSGYLSRRQHMKRWDNSVSAITDKPKLAEYAAKYRTYVNDPQEEFALVRQIGFFSYIAGVMATAFANLTQVPLMTVPTLGQVAPAPLVLKETARAYSDALKMLGKPSRVGLDMFDPEKAPEDVREALVEAWAEGSFVPLETFDLMMTARQRNVGSRKGVKAFNTATQVASVAFTFAERLNRLVTFMAAARLADKRAVQENAKRVLGKDALARQTVLGKNWTPKNFAEWAIDESQYRMGKANRPTMMRGVGSAVMQFKGFMLQTFEAWYRMSTLHGTEGKMAALASLAALVAIGGIWAFPGSDDLRKLIEAMYRQITDRDLDLKTELRAWVARTSGSNTIGQMVTKGASYPLGVDMTRVGLGTVMPDSPTAALGIPFDLMVGRPTRAFQKASNEDYIGAGAEFTPNFAKNMIVAGGWKLDGVRDKKGSRILTPDELTGGDVGMKAMGFQPSIVSDVRDYEYAQRRQETAVDALKRSYTNKIAKVIGEMERTDDPAKLQKLDARLSEIYAEIDAHNQNAGPEAVIQIGTRAIRSRVARELEGVKSTWGKERKASRGAAEDMRGLFGLQEDEQ